MANNVVLGILEVIALLSCVWGLHITIIDSTNYLNLGLVYSGGWFIFGIGANTIGVVAAYYGYMEERGLWHFINEETPMKKWLHRHYLLCWFTMIIGYPTLVSSFYMHFYRAFWVHIFGALSLIPVTIWFFRLNNYISFSTQGVIGSLIPIQLWISWESKNWSAVYGAGVMTSNLIAISIPTRYNLFGLTSREMFVAGVGVCSILFAQALDIMANDGLCPHCLK